MLQNRIGIGRIRQKPVETTYASDVAELSPRDTLLLLHSVSPDAAFLRLFPQFQEVQDETKVLKCYRHYCQV